MLSKDAIVSLRQQQQLTDIPLHFVNQMPVSECGRKNASSK